MSEFPTWPMPISSPLRQAEVFSLVRGPEWFDQAVVGFHGKKEGKKP
jgi:hypothetical protein